MPLLITKGLFNHNFECVGRGAETVTVDKAVAGDTPSPFINDHLSICLPRVGSNVGPHYSNLFFFSFLAITSSR